jgi:hypothetical protein
VRLDTQARSIVLQLRALRFVRFATTGQAELTQPQSWVANERAVAVSGDRVRVRIPTLSAAERLRCPA